MSLFDKINKGTYTATVTTDESNFGVGYTYNASYFSATGSSGYTFIENASSIDTVMWKDLTTSVVGSKYVMRFPFTLTSFTGHTTTGQNHKQEIGLGASYATGEDPTHDFVGLRYNAYQGDSTIKLHILARDGTTRTYSPALSVAYSSVSTPITWYMEIIKDDDSYTLNVYSDSSYSTSLGTATVTQTGITGLRYFNHHLFTQSTNGVSNGSSTGYDIYDGVTSVVATAGDVKPTNAQVGSRFEETDTRKMYHKVDVTGADLSLTGLKAYYKFDETTGNILNKATSIGSTVAVASSDLVVTGAERGVTGKLGKALYFDGSGDYAQATSAGTTGFNFMHQNGATFTVLSWYKVDAFTAGTNLIGTNQVSGSESGFLFALRHDDRKFDIFIGKSDSDLIDFSNSVQTPNDTDWHMLMVKYDDATGTVSASIDNGTVATSTGHNLTNTSNQTNYFTMGADGATNGSWNGDIDETSIWNRILTTAEITTIYNSGNGKVINTNTWSEEGT